MKNEKLTIGDIVENVCNTEEKIVCYFETLIKIEEELYREMTINRILQNPMPISICQII